MRFSSDGRRSWRWVLLSAALAAAAVPGGEAGAVERFEEADIFFELNATAGDVGVHVSLDAERWRSLRILDPHQREVATLDPKGSAAQIGLTELFFEGEEPSLKKVPFRRFLQLFPPGKYLFQATTAGGEVLRSKDRLSAQLPCPVTVVAPVATQPVPASDVEIRWETVRGVYNPDTKVCNHAVDVGLVSYQVIAEIANEAAGTVRSFVVDLLPGATGVRVPAEFFGAGPQPPGTELKFEVLGIEDTGNKTIVEQTFQVAAP